MSQVTEPGDTSDEAGSPADDEAADQAGAAGEGATGQATPDEDGSGGASNPPVSGTDPDVTSGYNEDTDLPEDQQTVVGDAPAAGADDPSAEPEDRSDPMQPDASPEEIEAERQERLDPDNRPDDAEVDNTQRDFDSEKGMFTDSEDYDSAEAKFPAGGPAPDPSVALEPVPSLGGLLDPRQGSLLDLRGATPQPGSGGVQRGRVLP